MYNNLRPHQAESQKAFLCPLAEAKQQSGFIKKKAKAVLHVFLLFIHRAAARYGFIHVLRTAPEQLH
jgi:hypothetical protein